ncbi:MAG: hypothetical protein ACJATV_001181 [Granulosicoccus sp.]|jgi:hypothetical protein
MCASVNEYYTLLVALEIMTIHEKDSRIRTSATSRVDVKNNDLYPNFTRTLLEFSHLSKTKNSEKYGSPSV